MARLIQIMSVTLPSFGQLPIKDNESTFTPWGKDREHHAGQNALDGGFTEKQNPSKLELTLNDTVDIDYYALNIVEDENITIEDSKGGVHMMPKAWCSVPCKPETGEVKIEFMANTSERIQ